MKKSPATPDKFPPNRRIPVVDLVRLASVFLIVGYHFFSSGISPTGYSPKTLHWIITLFPNGYYGVTFFFVISGFIITRILAGAQDDFSKVDLKSFYVKRAARIFPLFALTILTAWGMLTLDPEGPGAAYCLKAIGESFRWDFWLFLGTFQFNWFIIKESHLRPVALHWNILWTLAVEEQFYFFYPLIVKYLKTGAKILIFLGGVVFLGIVYRMAVLWCFPGNFTWGYISSFANFDQIAVGGVLFFVYEKLKKTKNVSPSFPTLCLALGMVLTGYVYFFTSNHLSGRVWEQTLMAAGCASVLLGALLIPSFNSSFWRFISWPGKLTYGCYLWQAIVLFSWWPWLVQIGHLYAFAFYLLGVGATAYGSYFIFEIPTNKLIRKIFRMSPSQTL